MMMVTQNCDNDNNEKIVIVMTMMTMITSESQFIIAFLVLKALMKNGASSETMTVDEFVVSAAEILLEQV